MILIDLFWLVSNFKVLEAQKINFWPKDYRSLIWVQHSCLSENPAIFIFRGMQTPICKRLETFWSLHLLTITKLSSRYIVFKDIYSWVDEGWLQIVPNLIKSRAHSLIRTQDINKFSLDGNFRSRSRAIIGPLLTNFSPSKWPMRNSENRSESIFRLGLPVSHSFPINCGF